MSDRSRSILAGTYADAFFKRSDEDLAITKGTFLNLTGRFDDCIYRKINESIIYGDYNLNFGNEIGIIRISFSRRLTLLANVGVDNEWTIYLRLVIFTKYRNGLYPHLRRCQGKIGRTFCFLLKVFGQLPPQL